MARERKELCYFFLTQRSRDHLFLKGNKERFKGKKERERKGKERKGKERKREVEENANKKQHKKD